MNVMMTKHAKKMFGFVIPETLLHTSAGGLLAVAATTACLCGLPKLGAMAGYPATNTQNQDASSLIANDIRRAGSLKQASEHQLVLNCGSATAPALVTYTYDAAAHTLTRKDDHSTRTVLTGVGAFSFRFFQHPTGQAAFNKLAPATAADARVVSCHWFSARRLGTAPVDSESIDLAPIVMRNHC